MSTETRTDAQRVTLPARAYTEPGSFERERRELFARSWNLVCHVSQVAEPGAYVTTRIAGEPVAVLRNAEGELAALSNVCRHRAMEVLSGVGSCPKVLRCPYHGWTYRQDGSLAAVPEARGFSDLDREAVRLPRFRAGELAGLVFACMSEETEPLEGYYGDLAERLAPFRIPELVVASDSRARPEFFDHNWKVIADNYLEGYHIPVGHPGLLRMLDYKRYGATLGTRHSVTDGPFRDKVSANRLERLYQRLMQPMPDFPADYAGAWTYVHLWPSTFLDIYPDMLAIWHTMPVSATRTRSAYTVLVHRDDSRRNKLARRINDRINRLVMDEDVTLCDGVMRGLHSLTYERGVLNENERAVGHFHDLVRAHVPGVDEA